MRNYIYKKKENQRNRCNDNGLDMSGTSIIDNVIIFFLCI